MSEKVETVRMFGKNENGVLVNADVHPDNVKAFEIQGWQQGEKADYPEWSSVSKPDPKPAKESTKDEAKDDKAKK